MEIQLIKQGHPFWEKTIRYAMNCTWKAGSILAEKMINNDFQNWERVIVTIEEGKIVAYCTFLERDELPEQYGYTPFIGFVFVDEKYRGKRISERMIDQATEYAKGLGYCKLFIMSGEKGLYEKYGFEKIGDYKTIYGTTDQLFVKKLDTSNDS